MQSGDAAAARQPCDSQTRTERVGDAPYRTIAADHHQVEAKPGAEPAGLFRHQRLSSSGKARALPRRQRLGSQCRLTTRLHLDNHREIAAAGNEVDLAGRGAAASGEDFEAVALEHSAAERLGQATKPCRPSAPLCTVPTDITPRPRSNRLGAGKRNRFAHRLIGIWARPSRRDLAITTRRESTGGIKHRFAASAFAASLLALARQAFAAAPFSAAVMLTLHDRQVATTEGLEHPWSIAWLADGTALVTERPGRLRAIRNGRLDPTPIAGGLATQDVRRTVLDAEGNMVRHESLRIGQRVRDVRQGPDGLIDVLTDEIHGRVFRLEPPA